MQKRIYILLSLFLVSILIITNAVYFGNEKTIEVQYTQLTTAAQKEVNCLAENIYHEAAYEPKQGRVAVALVTMNRVSDPRYPKDICSVVKQRIKSTCQFTWFCERGKSVKNQEAYIEARAIALYVYANYENIKDFTNGALFYHADYVNPRWPGLIKTTTIGRHIFYKERDPT